MTTGQCSTTATTSSAPSVVGVLPDNSVPWRGNSLLQEYAIPDGTKKYDFGGGWMTVREPAHFVPFLPAMSLHICLPRACAIECRMKTVTSGRKLTCVALL